MFLRKCAVQDANVDDVQSGAPGNFWSHEIPGLSEISASEGMKTTNSAQLFIAVLIFAVFLRSDVFQKIEVTLWHFPPTLTLLVIIGKKGIQSKVMQRENLPS